METFQEQYEQVLGMVIGELDAALRGVDPLMLERALGMILSCDKIFFVGVGRVLLSLQAVAKRFAHLGLDAHYVGEITEPAITPDDLLIVGSGSGESLFPLAIARKAKQIGARVLHIGSNPQGSMKEYADLMVRIPCQTKLGLPGEISSGQPMTSLFEQSLLLLGDILAKMIIVQKGLNMDALWRCHANLE